jgi:hypothetical protein
MQNSLRWNDQHLDLEVLEVKLVPEAERPLAAVQQPAQFQGRFQDQSHQPLDCKRK